MLKKHLERNSSKVVLKLGKVVSFNKSKEEHLERNFFKGFSFCEDAEGRFL
jgi:hypothetical protein